MSDRTGRIIMEIVRAIILERELDETLWLEVVLPMTHIKNLRPMQALERSISPAEMHDKDFPNLHHLRILGSTVHIFLHKEEWTLKSAKWDTKVLKK